MAHEQDEADGGWEVKATPQSPDQSGIIRQFKRTRWQQPGGGDEYQYFAYKNDPITRLKNVTEISFVLRHVVGPCVLDAGAGTGRFALPLQEKGYDTVAVDISREMLRQGVKQSAKSGTSFRCLVGDIEKLPFPDETFDSVVSITVLRHFPNWRDILREYVRVLRPRGRVVFDMASGDQRAFLAAHGGAARATPGDFDPLEFEAALSVRGLEGLTADLGLRIATVAPYDFFHVNELLRHALGEEYEAFEQEITAALGKPAAFGVCELLTRRALSRLSPALTSSWLMVIEKGGTPGEAWEPTYRGARTHAGNKAEDKGWEETLGQCVQGAWQELEWELQNAFAEADARAFFEMCCEELTSRFPLEALYWEAEE